MGMRMGEGRAADVAMGAAARETRAGRRKLLLTGKQGADASERRPCRRCRAAGFISRWDAAVSVFG
jgi:hypothetical protein